MINGIGRDVATMIWKSGAFELKRHEDNLNASDSPFSLNLRTAGKNPGPLKENDCKLIARTLWDRTVETTIKFDAIAAIPNTADPFIEAMQELKLIRKGVRVIKLAKRESTEGRRIIPMKSFTSCLRRKVILVDDSVTNAYSKLEAILAIREAGCEVVGLVVLIDLEQGGKEELEKIGYGISSCFTMKDLLDFYVDTNRVSRKRGNGILEYLQGN